MTNNEKLSILEYAAQAADLKIYGVAPYSNSMQGLVTDKHESWDPLTNNGEAFILAVQLGLLVHGDADDTGQVEVFDCDQTFVRIEPFNSPEDKEQATRLAIVRAAARLGKGDDL